MSAAPGDVRPLAAGVAISPPPISAAVRMLPGGYAPAPTFATGWTIGKGIGGRR